jgi:hypothetical protein
MMLGRVCHHRHLKGVLIACSSIETTAEFNRVTVKKQSTIVFNIFLD